MANVVKSEEEKGKPVLKIFLRYTERGEAVIREIKRVSKPGRRAYLKKTEIPRHKGGLGMHILSTSRGMMSDIQARREQLGGELICSVF